MRVINPTTFTLVLLLIAACSNSSPEISRSDAESALKIFGLEFTSQEIDSLLPDLEDQREGFQEMHEDALNNAVHNPLVFIPTSNRPTEKTPYQKRPSWIKGPSSLPASDHEIAFLSTEAQSALIKSGKLSSERLTGIYIERLKNFGDTLECVITLMEAEALEKARAMDLELRSGRYRGPLHGIPYGLKDLFAVAGTKTTWGATPYQDQVIDDTATLVEKLDEAGAVLVAKLTLGALAWGDVWYDGITKNPWNLNQGSSGSSAGSASATSAGLVSFSIGTETLGSIVSPSTRCGVSGLRPSFGAVSRSGGMALSWSMDKAGPICRSANDCALVFDAIRGYDPEDPATLDIPFSYSPSNSLKGLKVGYVPAFFERNYGFKTNDSLALEVFRSQGVELIPVELPSVPSGLRAILSAETAAAFDELTRTNRDDEMVRQIRNAWPNVIRAGRFIPAAEYINANRKRVALIEEVEELFEKVDVILTPSFSGSTLFLTNMTGHPCVVMPNGFMENGSPTSWTVISKLYEDEKALKVASWYQSHSIWDEQHPPLFKADAL